MNESPSQQASNEESKIKQENINNEVPIKYDPRKMRDDLKDFIMDNRRKVYERIEGMDPEEQFSLHYNHRHIKMPHYGNIGGNLVLFNKYVFGIKKNLILFIPTIVGIFLTWFGWVFSNGDFYSNKLYVFCGIPFFFTIYFMVLSFLIEPGIIPRKCPEFTKTIEENKINDEKSDEINDENDKNKKDEKETERIKQETEAINTEYKRRESLLKEDYARGVKDRETYNREMESLEIERIQKVLQISSLEPEKVAELENRIRDFAVKAREALAGIEYAPKNLTLYERYEEETVKLETELRKQKAVLEENLTLGNMDREQYNDAVTQLDEKFVRDQDALWQQYVEDMVKSGDEMVSATDDKMERLEQTMREAGVSIKDLTMEIGKAIGQGLVDAVNSDIDGVKDVFKTLLKVIIDAVEKMLIAAEVESSLLTLSGIGTAAGLANLAKLAAITALFEGLKAMVDGWASGGYTSKGDWREPAGIVHKGEFVASHEAVKNPEVKQVLDVIDEAQKRGTVGSLRGEDITEATRRVNVMQGTEDVPEMPDGGDVTRRVNVKQGTVDVPEMPDGGDVTRHVNVKQGTVDVPKIAAAEDVTRRVNVKQGTVDVPEMPDGGDVTRRVNVKQGMVDVPEVSIPADMAVAETIRRVIKDAQWTGSVANLAPSDIAATATRMERTTERVTPTRARHEIQQPPVYDYSELTETLQELKARLDEPIVAETYATGKGGTMTAAALVEKMMSNASRPRRK